MTCSRLMIKGQETSLFTVSFAFVGRFKHDAVLLIFILLRDNLSKVFSRTKESGFSFSLLDHELELKKWVFGFGGWTKHNIDF